jgi:APA family basic amino acid/polyamine antiporter
LRSLVLQTLITIGLIVACRDQGGFERLVVFTAPFYWGFIALVGIGLIVLRWRGATRHAAYHVPFSPVTPLLFTATSAAMVYAGIDYALQQRLTEVWWAIGITLAGIVVGIIDWRARRR